MLNAALCRNDTLRWCGSFMLVVAVYVSAVLITFNHSSLVPPERGEPMAAMMIELAPIPVAPKEPPTVAPPGLQQPEVETQPKAEPEPNIDPLPALPEINTAEAILPVEPELLEEVELEEKAEPEQQEQAPPTFEAPADDSAAAPREGAVSLTPSQTAATWQSVLLGHLEHHKRYPRESRRRRQEAVVYVRVEINRDGTVVDYTVERPCRYEPLNQESLALIARAQPLPPPPQDVAGETITFVVPVEFSLRR